MFRDVRRDRRRTSPQITDQDRITGRASLRAPTCYKECNLVAIEKHCDGKVVDRWTGLAMDHARSLPNTPSSPHCGWAP